MMARKKKKKLIVRYAISIKNIKGNFDPGPYFYSGAVILHLIAKKILKNVFSSAKNLCAKLVSYTFDFNQRMFFCPWSMSLKLHDHQQ